MQYLQSIFAMETATENRTFFYITVLFNNFLGNHYLQSLWLFSFVASLKQNSRQPDAHDGINKECCCP